MRVHLIEPIGITDSELKTFENKLNKIGLDLFYWNDRKEDTKTLINRCKDADIIIVSNIPISADIINACPHLKLISVAFTGIDHIDLKACEEKSVTICNAAGYSTKAVAELTINLMISIYRKIIDNHNKTINNLDRNSFVGNELSGKTIGLIGAGAIGQKVAKICNVAFDCKVLYYNRSKKDVIYGKQVDLDTLLKKSDVVSLHLPYNEETKGLLSKTNIEKMKPTSILINTARGPIVDYFALSKILNENKIAGAAVDVYEYEPPLKNNHPLLKTKNIILLPHIAYATKESFKLRANIVFENIIKWKNGEIQNRQL